MKDKDTDLVNTIVDGAINSHVDLWHGIKETDTLSDGYGYGSAAPMPKPQPKYRRIALKVDGMQVYATQWTEYDPGYDSGTEHAMEGLFKALRHVQGNTNPSTFITLEIV